MCSYDFSYQHIETFAKKLRSYVVFKVQMSNPHSKQPVSSSQMKTSKVLQKKIKEWRGQISVLMYCEEATAEISVVRMKDQTFLPQ